MKLAISNASLVLLTCFVTAATAATSPAGYKAPRTSFGDPDLQGLWTNASVTTLERPPGVNKLVVTEEEAKTIAGMTNSRMDSDKRPTDPNAPPPTAGDDVRGYNTFWLDLGRTLARVNGEYRTSWVVDPSTGRVPYTDAGMQAMRTAAFRNFDDPEVRSLGERCIVGYGSTGGPPMLNVLYNNNYQIVQSPGYVTIVVEMNHDARIIRLNGQHLPDHIRPWMGDSVGHWEGDTLVVETTNLNPGQAFTADIRHRLYVPPTAKITEKFTRVSKDEILYQFTVEDAKAYTQTWRGEIPMRATKGPMYEYACHEGNHSLENILRGARFQERQAAGGNR